MKYNTKGKTIAEVVKETREIIKKHRINKPKGKLYYIKKYQDCTAIIESKTTGKMYVNQLYDIYGPFKTLQLCSDFRHILNLENNALRQAEVNSWN
jgi:hypothetical protein